MLTQYRIYVLLFVDNVTIGLDWKYYSSQWELIFLWFINYIP